MDLSNLNSTFQLSHSRLILVHCHLQHSFDHLQDPPPTQDTMATSALLTPQDVLSDPFYLRFYVGHSGQHGHEVCPILALLSLSHSSFLLH